MATISKITLGSTTYEIKDAESRQLIQQLNSAAKFLGISTTAITDGGAEKPTISGSAVSDLSAGDIVIYDSKEFIYGNDSKWHEFGDIDLSGLGEFAYADKGEASYKPSGQVSIEASTPEGTVETTITSVTGTVSQPTFTANKTTIEQDIPVPGAVTSQFTGDELESTGTFTPAGTISQITPEGTIDSFTPTIADIPEFGIEVLTGVQVETATFSGTAAKPTGTINTNAYNASVEESTETLKLVPCTATFAGDNFTPTGSINVEVGSGGKGQRVNVLPSDAFSSLRFNPITPTFKGKAVTPTFSGNAGAVTVKGTPTGEIDSDWRGSAHLSTEFTVTGTVSQPTFSNGAAVAESTFVGEELEVSGSFDGTQATIEVNPKK